MNCDLLILGAGPGGYTAALEGARAGLRTILVEQGFLGGTCLNWGCIPTKLFLGATQTIPELKAQSRLRIATGEIVVDLPGLQRRKRTLVQATRKSMALRLEQTSVKLVQGVGRLTGPNTVAVESEGTFQEIRFTSLVLAVGSRPAFPPGLVRDGAHILDSTDMLDLEEIPPHLAVVGAGAIGIELGQFFNRLGSTISLIEMAPSVLPAEDPEISGILAWSLKRQGWTIHTSTTVERVATTDEEVQLSLSTGKDVRANKVLVAIGRMPNTAGLGLENTTVNVDRRGWIATDESLQAADGIFAVGDVSGRALLAHAAEDQARYVVRRLLGRTTEPYRSMPVPSCLYGEPEAFRAGKSFRELLKEGDAVKSSRYQLAASPVAQAFGSSHGLIKVFWSNGKVVGITGIGHRTTGLVTLAEVMVNQGWDREHIHEIVVAHPTMDEALKEALLAEQKEISS
jgi:dihydrolipoamide dehydrogenase